jgi:hypothetical protein
MVISRHSVSLLFLVMRSLLSVFTATCGRTYSISVAICTHVGLGNMPVHNYTSAALTPQHASVDGRHPIVTSGSKQGEFRATEARY